MGYSLGGCKSSNPFKVPADREWSAGTSLDCCMLGNHLSLILIAQGHSLHLLLLYVFFVHLQIVSFTKSNGGKTRN
jgi:hypothetical protein